MKKFLSILLVLVCIISIVTTACAATVIGGNLRMRKQPSTSGTIIGWLANGTSVTITSTPNATFYGVTGMAWQHHDLTGWYQNKSGYAMQQYIQK